MSVFLWAFVPIAMISFNCPSVRLSLSVEFDELWAVGRNPSGSDYKGRHSPFVEGW